MTTDYTYHLSAHWQHEFRADSLEITSGLQSPGITPLTVNSASRERDSAVLDAGLDAQVLKNMDVYVDYQA